MPTFLTKPTKIHAVRKPKPFVISTPSGPLCGKAGDWVIINDAGGEEIMVAEEFTKLHEAVDYVGESMLKGFI